MRYVVAALVAILIIAGGFLFAWVTNRQTESQIRAAVREQQESGKLPPELEGKDIDSLQLEDLRDFKVKLPASNQWRLDLARVVTVLWYIWAPAVIGLCFGVAAIIGRFRRKG